MEKKPTKRRKTSSTPLGKKKFDVRTDGRAVIVILYSVIIVILLWLIYNHNFGFGQEFAESNAIGFSYVVIITLILSSLDELFFSTRNRNSDIVSLWNLTHMSLALWLVLLAYNITGDYLISFLSSLILTTIFEFLEFMARKGKINFQSKVAQESKWNTIVDFSIHFIFASIGIIWIL